MNTLKVLIVCGAVATVLAIAGVTAVAVALNPSAADIVQRGHNTQGALNPSVEPPPFYGSR